MKAAVINGYGPADKFRIQQADDPKPQEGQVLVKNLATSVNPVDTIVRSGMFRLFTGLFGEHIIGSDFCGVVVASRSNAFKEGDEVFGFNRAIKGGAYAELLAVDASIAAPRPRNISCLEAASLALVGTTAWQALVELGKIKQGMHVLINGCTGGVGSAAVQIAKSFNTTVTGVCNGNYADYARSLGCDEVIDYKTQKIPAGKKYDLILDSAGKLTISDIKESLAKDAMFVTTKGHLDSAAGIFRTATDLLFNSQMKFVMLKPSTEILLHLKELVEHGKLKPTIHRTYPLEQIALAHKVVEEESFPGKIAVEIQ